MKKLSLEFPSTKVLSDFLTETNNPTFNPTFPAKTLSGEFSDEELTLAVGTYNATPLENAKSETNKPEND